VQEAGGNPYVGTGDLALGYPTAEEMADAMADADAAATSKVGPVGGKKPPGGGGAAGAKSGIGSSDPWAEGGGGGGRTATAAEELGEAGSRFARFGKALKIGGKALKIGGTVAFVVTGGIAAGTALFHLYKGQYREAAIDVADFVTLGAASYVPEKTAEAAQAIGEGIEAGAAIWDWTEGGGVPPPQPGEGTPEQREEYYRRQQQSRSHNPWRFGL